VVFYASNLTDGEFLEECDVIRRGALPATTAFCLIQQLLEDLTAAAKKFARLTSHMKVSNPLVTTLEDAFSSCASSTTACPARSLWTRSSASAVSLWNAASCCS